MSHQLNRAKGTLGESLAVKYLQDKGLKLLKKNWYCNHGEIDLILNDNGLLVFTEVKYVSNTRYCEAVELFSQRKRKNLLRTIDYFVHRYKNITNWRLDLVCITKDKGKFWVQYFKNVLLNS